MNLESYKTIKCGEENNEEMALQYFLSSREVLNENENNTVYGIQVTKIAESETETQFVDGISYDKHKVSDMIEKISNGYVTPATLVDIIEDMIE